MQREAYEQHNNYEINIHVHACGIQTRHLIARTAQDRALIMIGSSSV